MSILFSKMRQEAPAGEEQKKEEAVEKEIAELEKQPVEEKAVARETEAEAAEAAATEAEEEAAKAAEEAAAVLKDRRSRAAELIEKAAAQEKDGDPEAAQESLLKALKLAQELEKETGEAEDKDRLKEVYRQLAKLGYALNQYYTEQSAKCLIEAVNAQQEQDAAREAECRKRGEEYSRKAAGCMAASQKYDRLLRESR